MVGLAEEKVAVWASFLDADAVTSIQRRAYIKPSAFTQITSISEADLIGLSYGFQETISKALVGKIFIARFVVSKKFMQIVSFTQ